MILQEKTRHLKEEKNQIATSLQNCLLKSFLELCEDFSLSGNSMKKIMEMLSKEEQQQQLSETRSAKQVPAAFGAGRSIRKTAFCR